MSNKNLEIIKELFELPLDQQYNEVVVSKLEEDVQWVDHGDVADQFNGFFFGKKKVKQHLEDCDYIIDYLSVEVQEYIVSSNKVIVQTKDRYRLKTSGREYDMNSCQIFTLSPAGKISNFVGYWCPV